MPNVLVIEDDADTRELERYALTCAGHEVVLAANGNEGLRALERQRPCLIILDLMMPVMDGLTFLAERRRRDICTDVPVICISAAGPASAAQALRLGARECLSKPTDFDDLSMKINAYCA